MTAPTGIMSNAKKKRDNAMQSFISTLSALILEANYTVYFLKLKFRY